MNDEMTIPVSVNYEGRDYPIRWIKCGRCTNWWLTVDLPEHAPSFCCYCGMNFRYYEDDEGQFRDLGDRAIDPPKGKPAP